MMQMFQNLSPRERGLVTLLLPVVILAAGFQFLWTPLQARRAALGAEIAAYTQVIDRVAAIGTSDSTAPDVVQMAETPRLPLSTRVTQSAESAGLELRRLERYLG
jgi:general secretion pathway protein M